MSFSLNYRRAEDPNATPFGRTQRPEGCDRCEGSISKPRLSHPGNESKCRPSLDLQWQQNSIKRLSLGIPRQWYPIHTQSYRKTDELR